MRKPALGDISGTRTLLECIRKQFTEVLEEKVEEKKRGIVKDNQQLKFSWKHTIGLIRVETNRKFEEL